MNRYELTLKNNKSLGLDVLSWFITAYNLLVFLGYGTWFNKQGLIGAGAIVLAFLILRLMKKNSYATNFFLLLVPVIPWLIFEIYALSIASLVLAGLFYVANKPKIVQLDEHGIKFPSFPTRTHLWQQVNQSMLKDGLLTIDFKNNKLIQQLIEDAGTINEKEFNEFCREQVTK